jgi:hypothetical protein
VSGRARDEARRWLWHHSGRDRQRSCGRTVVGHEAQLVRGPHGARFAGLECCGSIWSCPVCSAKILAGRAEELTAALDQAHALGLQVAMVTLTMRHGRGDSLERCWDALSDAWAYASGRSSGVRRAKDAAGFVGFVRRVESTWGERSGWHAHVHALVFVDPAEATSTVTDLGLAMYAAWESRLARAGLTPLRDLGGLNVRELTLAAAREEIGRYVSKGAYTATESAALELAGAGKLGRRGNLTPWGILDAARQGDRRARALWAEWEETSLGRRALTWSVGLRDLLALPDEQDDDGLVADVDAAVEVVALWHRDDWPVVRDAPWSVREGLLLLAGLSDIVLAFDEVQRACQVFGLPVPRPGPDVPL